MERHPEQSDNPVMYCSRSLSVSCGNFAFSVAPTTFWNRLLEDIRNVFSLGNLYYFYELRCSRLLSQINTDNHLNKLKEIYRRIIWCIISF